ncbi:hypothetical protein IFR04_015670, partial [Cadophora malorum]
MSSTIPDFDTTNLAESRLPHVLIGVILPFAISSICLLGRFYSRAVLLKFWGIDDTLLLMSWLSGGVVLGALNVVLAQSGTGKPTKLRTPAQDSDAMRLGFVCKELYTFTLMTVKLAICAFYARIFQDKGGRLFIYSMSGFVVLSTIPIMVAHGLRCDPPAGAWSLMPAKCHSESPIIISSAVFNILSDIALLAFILPRI